MRKFALLAACLTVLLAPVASYAGSAEIGESLQTARSKLVALLGSTDKGTQSALVEQIKKATQEVDANIEKTLADPSTSADLKAKLAEFKATWKEFQHTRDSEIIPAVMAGNADKAKSLAQGIQVERFKKMMRLLQ